MFVPVFGDWIATPAKTSEPSTTPTVTAVKVLHQLSPKTMPSDPKTILPKPNCGPNMAHARSLGCERRSPSAT